MPSLTLKSPKAWFYPNNSSQSWVCINTAKKFWNTDVYSLLQSYYIRISKEWDLQNHSFKKYIHFNWNKICLQKKVALINVQLKEFSPNEHTCILATRTSPVSHLHALAIGITILRPAQQILMYSQGWEPLYQLLTLFYITFSVLVEFWGMSYETLLNHILYVGDCTNMILFHF